MHGIPNVTCIVHVCVHISFLFEEIKAWRFHLLQSSGLSEFDFKTTNYFQVVSFLSLVYMGHS
jgi:hypothetical protein